MPHVAEDYVHRIGRTGRAGAEGEAVSLVSHEDRPLLAAIERLMNRPVESRVIAGFEPGTASSRPAEKSEPRRQPQQQRRGQQRQPQRQGQQRQRQQQRPQPQQNRRPARHNGRPHRLPEHAPAAHSAEREAQIREARARMAEEGDTPEHKPSLTQRFVGALVGRKPS